jgi:hypothetical protein
MFTKEDLEKFSTHLFWDTNIDAILRLSDPLPFLVQRVLEYGHIADWFCLKELIGLKKIADVAVKIKNLDYKSARLVSVVSGESIEKFQCYITRQSTQNFWNS